MNNKNLQEKHFKTKRKASLKVLKQKLKQNKEKKHSFHKDYKNGSRTSEKR